MQRNHEHKQAGLYWRQCQLARRAFAHRVAGIKPLMPGLIARTPLPPRLAGPNNAPALEAANQRAAAGQLWPPALTRTAYYQLGEPESDARSMGCIGYAQGRLSAPLPAPARPTCVPTIELAHGRCPELFDCRRRCRLAPACGRRPTLQTPDGTKKLLLEPVAGGLLLPPDLVQLLCAFLFEIGDL